MSDPVNALTLQFLDWVASQPCSYAEAMGAWRTSCPKMSIWEDAIAAGWVRVENKESESAHKSKVVLTDRGRLLPNIEISEATVGPPRR